MTSGHGAELGMSPAFQKTLMTSAGVIVAAVGAVLATHPKFAPIGAALVWVGGVLKGGAWIQEPATTQRLVKRAADAVAKEER